MTNGFKKRKRLLAGALPNSEDSEDSAPNQRKGKTSNKRILHDRKKKQSNLKESKDVPMVNISADKEPDFKDDGDKSACEDDTLVIHESAASEVEVVDEPNQRPQVRRRPSKYNQVEKRASDDEEDDEEFEEENNGVQVSAGNQGKNAVAPIKNKGSVKTNGRRGPANEINDDKEEQVGVGRAKRTRTLSLKPKSVVQPKSSISIRAEVLNEVHSSDDEEDNEVIEDENAVPKEKKPRNSDDEDRRRRNVDSDSDMSLVDLEIRTAGSNGAAFQSRLSNEFMTNTEKKCFPNLQKSNPAYELFFQIRNKILQLWLENPLKELPMITAMSRLQTDYPSLFSDGLFVIDIFHYLQRHGLINFGVYQSSKLTNKIVTTDKKFGTILVIGAGMAGLACARQLQSFGFDVAILEARDRVGGRIATFRKANFTADLGAMVVTGLGGNPTSILSKQVNLELYKIKHRCPLYQNDGTQVSRGLDEVTEREFNRLLEATSYISHSLNLNYMDGKPISLGAALELIISLQQKRTVEKMNEYNRIRIAFYDELLTRQEKVNEFDRKINQTHQKWLDVECVPQPRAMNIEIRVKMLEADLNDLYKDRGGLLDEIDELTEALEDLETHQPCDVYLGPLDRQVLDWHFANLEFANATSLDTLSLRHWDQDDEFEFAGNHLYVKNGFSAIPISLSQGLNIKLNRAVRKIEVTKSGAKVTTSNSHTNANVEVHKAELVVVTLPLGVLKDSLRSSVNTTTRDSNDINDGGNEASASNENVSAGAGNGIQFIPPLPEWKNAAISRLGFGCLNKVVLCFDKIFWNPTINLFGHIGQTVQSRGELFMFWNFSKSPVLIALIAGNAAAMMESVSDDICIARALTVLKTIFGNNKVPQPKETVVTRWRSDVFARGSYSYVAAGSTGSDYDTLATPIILNKNENRYNELDAHINQPSRMFFAGEHTIRDYPATVHGAYLSGLREAARITDQLIGT